MASNAIFSFKCTEKIVALTIDDGPDAKTTKRIISVLSDYDSTATFFVIGERSTDDLLSFIAVSGNEIGNHTYRNEPSDSLAGEALLSSVADTHTLIKAHQPEVMWFRPGMGRYNTEVLDIVANRNYKLVLADVFPYDHLIKSSKFHSWYINHSVRPGSIIVLHDHGELGQRTIKTLSSLLPKLKESGYRVMSLGELVESGACSPVR